MPLLTRVLAVADRLRPPPVASAHCDVPCGVYDPAQARIEAQSVKALMEKYQASDDDVFRARCLFVKDERAELVKRHLWVLWTDYFQTEHLEKYPNLHEMFWRTTKLAGEAKHTVDPGVADALLAGIDEIAQVFWDTQGVSYSPPEG